MKRKVLTANQAAEDLTFDSISRADHSGATVPDSHRLPLPSGLHRLNRETRAGQRNESRDIAFPPALSVNVARAVTFRSRANT